MSRKEGLMKARPIHYTRAMRDARRAGLKTQTRRVLRRQPYMSHTNPPRCSDAAVGDLFVCPDYFPTSDEVGVVMVECESVGTYHSMGQEAFVAKHSPYGVPGDILYVHEPVEFLSVDNKRRVGLLGYLDDGVTRTVDIPGRVKLPRLGRWKGRTLPPEWAREHDRIIDVRVERVQDISEEDATAEGVPVVAQGEHGAQYMTSSAQDGEFLTYSAKMAFAHLWDSINAKRGFSWEKNPWCWVVQFEKIRP